MLSHAVGNKARMSALPTLIEYSAGNSNQWGKEKKRYTDWKERYKTVLIADVIIGYIENSRESTKYLRTNKWVQHSFSIQAQHLKKQLYSYILAMST